MPSLTDRLQDAVDLARTPRELENLCAEALTELRRLGAERDALKEDAERYRWLRTNYDPAIWDLQGEQENLDAAIDAAKPTAP